MILLLSLGGCQAFGAAARMARSAQDADRDIEQAEKEVHQIREADAAGHAIEPHIENALVYMASARENIGEVTRTIPLIKNAGVQFEDWMDLGKLWAWITIIGGVIFLLIYLGLGPVIRQAFNAVGMFIGKATRAKAVDDFTILQNDPRPQDWARHAGRMAKDPGYRRTYEKLSKDAYAKHDTDRTAA